MAKRQELIDGLPERLAALMAAREDLSTQQAVSNATGISQTQIGRILRGESTPSMSKIIALAEAFQVPLAMLVDITSLIDTIDAIPAHLLKAGYHGFKETETLRSMNVGEPIAHLRKAASINVPLISWVRAGSFDSASDPFAPGDAEKWLPCPVPHGSHTFALRVRGDSMTSPHGKSYADGSIIYVDPALRSPNSGQRIIAKLDGTDEVTFKVYQEDAGVMWLKPLNPDYPLIRAEFRVLGTVIGKWEDE